MNIDEYELTSFDKKCLTCTKPPCDGVCELFSNDSTNAVRRNSKSFYIYNKCLEFIDNFEENFFTRKMVQDYVGATDTSERNKVKQCLILLIREGKIHNIDLVTPNGEPIDTTNKKIFIYSKEKPNGKYIPHPLNSPNHSNENDIIKNLIRRMEKVHHKNRYYKSVIKKVNELIEDGYDRFPDWMMDNKSLCRQLRNSYGNANH